MQSADRQFYVSSYFMTNLLLICLYPVLRQWTDAGRRDLKHEDSFGFTYENSIIYTGLLLISLSYVRATSLKSFLLDSTVVVKLIIVGLLYMAKIQYCIAYVCLCAVCWTLTPYPRYTAQNNFTALTSEQQLDAILEQGQKHLPEVKQMHGCQYMNKFMCFIEFYSNGVTPCIVAKELWYAFSIRYATQSFVFLQVNVDRCPELAKRFSINTTGFSKQLPTALILENGVESIRFPTIKENQKVDRVAKLDYKILLTYFDLQSRYLETREIVLNNKS